MSKKNKLEHTRITFGTAKLLKSIGFNMITGAYWHDGVDLILIDKSSIDNNVFEHSFEAPTHGQLLTWLMEQHELHVYALSNHSGWFWEMCKTNGTSIKWSEDEMWHEAVSGESYDPASGQWLKYRDALEDGLHEALTMIKGGWKA